MGCVIATSRFLWDRKELGRPPFQSCNMAVKKMKKPGSNRRRRRSWAVTGSACLLSYCLVFDKEVLSIKNFMVFVDARQNHHSNQNHNRERTTRGDDDGHDYKPRPSSSSSFSPSQEQQHHSSTIDEYCRNHHRWQQQQHTSSSPLSPRRQQQQHPQRPGLAYFSSILPKSSPNENNPLWNIEDVHIGQRQGPMIIPPPTKTRRQTSRRKRRCNDQGSSPNNYSQKRSNTNNNPTTPIRQIAAGGSSPSDIYSSSVTAATSGRFQPRDDLYSNRPENRGSVFQFKPRYGKVSIDLGCGSNSVEQDESNIDRPKIDGPRNRRNPVIKKADKVTSGEEIGDKHREKGERSPSLASDSSATELSVLPSTIDIENKDDDDSNSASISVSIDPAATLRLTKASIKGSQALANAFIGTICVVGPMIVARRVLTTLGYMGYDYYSGRYIRHQYNHYWEKIQYYNVWASCRALGRFFVQLISMDFVGKLSILVLNKSPCWMPPIACHYWYGVVCISLVIISAKVSELLWTTNSCPPLAIYTADKDNNSNTRSGRKRYFSRPWHALLQWLKDPDAWIEQITKHNHQSNRIAKYVPFQPDSLLFPSTWPPLHVVTVLAMLRAIRIRLKVQTNDDVSSLSSLPTVGMLLRKYCITHALYEEWYRVFLKEKRVTLALAVHGIYFLAILNLIYNVASVDGIAGLLLIATKVASLVSAYMTFVIYKERVVSSTQSLRAKSSRRRSNKAANKSWW